MVLNVTGGLWVSVPMRCCWVPHPSMQSLSLKHMPRSSIFRYTNNVFQVISTRFQSFHPLVHIIILVWQSSQYDIYLILKMGDAAM